MTFYSARELVGKRVRLRHEYLGDQGYCAQGHLFTIVKVKDGLFYVEDTEGGVLNLLPGWFDLVKEKDSSLPASKSSGSSKVEVKHTVTVNGKDIKSTKELDEAFAGMEDVFSDVDKVIEDAFTPVSIFFSRLRPPFLRLRKVVEKIEESEKEKEGK